MAEPTQNDSDKRLLEATLSTLGQWEPYHKRWQRKADHYYGLYRNYQDLRSSIASTTSPRGRDLIIADARSEFDRELFIPMGFSTVETILPAMLTNSPQMDVRPRTPGSESNAPVMKALLEAQQEQIHYSLRLQTIGKDGLIYGTGVQKVYWRKDFARRPQIVQREGGGLGQVTTLREVFDDPDAEAVDPIDFIADPFAERIDKCEGAFHRTWRSTRYVQQMVETGRWRNLDGLAGDDLAALASTKTYDEVWAARRRADGAGSTSSTTPGNNRGRTAIHEVLEFHDGEQVVTILDRKVVVASGPNPNWHGELPFQVYRPTEDPHRLHGIGEIEPIEQLIDELNVLRTQRRYNADLVLQRTFAYTEGVIDPSDIQFGPGYQIPVPGDPRELLFPIPVGDIPHSGYEEEDRISSDIDRTSGISDVIAGAGLQGGGGTATGVQLVQSAASRRIENKTRRLGLEIINPGGAQFVSLSQQRILQNRTIRVPARPTPGEPDRRWAWLSIGPEDLYGEFEVKSVLDATQPENIPQNRADAQMAMALFGQNPAVDQRKVTEFAVGKLGVPHPQDWMAPPDPTVPAAVLDRLAQRGVPPADIMEALREAGGPDLTGGNPPSRPEGEPQPPSSNSNGAQPEEEQPPQSASSSPEPSRSQR